MRDKAPSVPCMQPRTLAKPLYCAPMISPTGACHAAFCRLARLNPALSSFSTPVPAGWPPPGRRFSACRWPAVLGVAASLPAVSWGLVGWALLAVLLLQAGVNVFNDYYDHDNGCDAANTERVFPFTGGSRFIQNG